MIQILKEFFCLLKYFSCKFKINLKHKMFGILSMLFEGLDFEHIKIEKNHVRSVAFRNKFYDRKFKFNRTLI